MYSKQCFLCWSARKARLVPCQRVSADILYFLFPYSQSLVMIVQETLSLLNILHFPASESFIISVILEMFATQQPYSLFLFLLSCYFLLDGRSSPFPALLAVTLDLFSKKACYHHEFVFQFIYQLALNYIDKTFVHNCIIKNITHFKKKTVNLSLPFLAQDVKKSNVTLKMALNYTLAFIYTCLGSLTFQTLYIERRHCIDKSGSIKTFDF